MESSTLAAGHLTDGWEPDTPAGDTMLRRFLFNQAELNEAFATATGGTVYRDEHLSLADLGHPGAYFNAALLLAPPAGGAEGRLLAQVEDLFAGGRGTVCLWSAWPLGDLTIHGWELSGHPPLLLRPPGVAPPAPSLDVRGVDGPSALEAWESVAVHGYPFPQLADEPPGSLADPSLLGDGRFGFWVGYHEGIPVSMATSFAAHGLVNFALGVTLPSARRRGFWRRHAIDRLCASPGSWAAGVFSDHSRPGAEALGFVPVVRLTLWTRERS